MYFALSIMQLDNAEILSMTFASVLIGQLQIVFVQLFDLFL